MSLVFCSYQAEQGCNVSTFMRSPSAPSMMVAAFDRNEFLLQNLFIIRILAILDDLWLPFGLFSIKLEVVGRKARAQKVVHSRYRVSAGLLPHALLVLPLKQPCSLSRSKMAIANPRFGLYIIYIEISK